MEEGISPEPRLMKNTSDFNVDPNAPFLGGGVNPSSYGDPNAMTSPPQRPSQPTRMNSLKRWVPNMPRIGRRAPDVEEGYLSDFTVPTSPETAYTNVPPASHPQDPRAHSRPAPGVDQLYYNYQASQASPEQTPRHVSTTPYQHAQVYQSQNLRTPSSRHTATAPQSEESFSEEEDVEPTLVGHESYQPPLQPPEPIPVRSSVNQSAVNLAPDYAKMEEPKHPPHHFEPSRVQRFFESMNKMPWISKEGRITVDYYPSREKRPDIPYNARDPVPSMYSPVQIQVAVDPRTEEENIIEPFTAVSAEVQPIPPQMAYIPPVPPVAQLRYPQGGYTTHQPVAPHLTQTPYPISPTMTGSSTTETHSSMSGGYPQNMTYTSQGSRPYSQFIPTPP